MVVKVNKICIKIVVRGYFIKNYIHHLEFKNGSKKVEKFVYSLLNENAFFKTRGSYSDVGYLVFDTFEFKERIRKMGSVYLSIVLEGNFEINENLVAKQELTTLQSFFVNPQELLNAEVNFYKLIRTDVENHIFYEASGEVSSGAYKMKTKMNRFNYLEYGTSELLEDDGKDAWRCRYKMEILDADTRIHLTDGVYSKIYELVGELVRSKPPIIPNGVGYAPMFGAGIVEELVEEFNLNHEERARAIQLVVGEIEVQNKLGLEYEYR